MGLKLNSLVDSKSHYIFNEIFELRFTMLIRFPSQKQASPDCHQSKPKWTGSPKVRTFTVNTEQKSKLYDGKALTVDGSI